MKDEQLSLFEKARDDLCRKLASCFKDVTEEEAASIEDRNLELTHGLAEHVNKDYIYQQLEAQGHSKAKIDQFYSMLDLRIANLNHTMELFKQDHYDELRGKKKSKPIPISSLSQKSQSDGEAELSTEEVLSQ